VTLPVILADSDRIVFGDQELRFHQAKAPQSGIFEPNLDTRNAPTTAMHAHRLATIVVVDIRDFTPLARSISESLLSQTIGTWFLRVGQIVQGLGSWGQRYIGDAVMAVWVHDDPEHLRRELLRSLRAVTDIETATGEISQSLPLPGPLRIGAGVNTGSAIIGGSDYTAMGDTVNAAFRLESATKLLGLNVAARAAPDRRGRQHRFCDYRRQRLYGDGGHGERGIPARVSDQAAGVECGARRSNLC
jgi:adenylate cyclase